MSAPRAARLCRVREHDDASYRLLQACAALEGIAGRPDLDHEAYRRLVARRVTGALAILRGDRCSCSP